MFFIVFVLFVVLFWLYSFCFSFSLLVVLGMFVARRNDFFGSLCICFSCAILFALIPFSFCAVFLRGFPFSFSFDGSFGCLVLVVSVVFGLFRHFAFPKS